MSFLDKYTEQEIADYIAESVNIAEVLRKMGQSANSGSNRILISHYVKEHNLDISHFNNFSNIRTPKDIFIEKSSASQNTVRKYYKRGNYSEYKCAICGLNPFWNGKELTLTLDHINGVSDDHRLENLRWICPNCDRQLPTYGSKRRKQHLYCKNCGEEIKRGNKTGFCKKCYWDSKKSTTNKSQSINEISAKTGICLICGKSIDKRSTYCNICEQKQRRDIAIQNRIDKGITREFLKNEIRTKPFLQIAKEQGVTDNTIRKWCKRYNLPFRATEIQKISDEDWKLI